MEGIPVVTQKEFQKDLAELRTKILAMEAREHFLRSNFEQLRIAFLGYQPANPEDSVSFMGYEKFQNRLNMAEQQVKNYEQHINRLEAVNTEQKIRLNTAVAQADFLWIEVNRLRQKVAEHNIATHCS